MVIEYLVMPYFCWVINTRFSHYEDFDNFPGQVYFVIILDACNTYSIFNIEDEEKYFTNLSFNDFPVKNITYIATTFLRNIKVMRGEYALPQKLGTTFFWSPQKFKWDFNWNILNLYANNDEI